MIRLRPLYITINYDKDSEFVKKEINSKHPRVIILRSSEDEYNVKTHRIAQEMQEHGLKIIDVKYTQKKNPSKRNLIKIILLLSVVHLPSVDAFTVFDSSSMLEPEGDSKILFA